MARRTEEWPVYGGPGFVPMPQPYRGARIIVCAPSGAAARRAMEVVGWTVSRGDWAFGWCETGNELEVAVARACPQVPLYQPEWGSGHDWPRGAWVPLGLPIPRAPQPTGTPPGYDPTPCTGCGTSVDDCDAIVFGPTTRLACCDACARDDTHNDPIDHPLHRERIRRNAEAARAASRG